MRGRAAASFFVVAGLLTSLARPASAQGILSGLQKSVETVFTAASTTTTSASGTVTKSDSTNFFPSLNLNLNTLLFPSVRLSAGGVFELDMLSTRSGGSEVSSTITRNRPFVLLRSINPVLSPGFGYFRREERARIAGLSDVKLINDEFDAYLGWLPAGGPKSEFQFVRTHTYDGERAFQDTTKGFGSLTSNYLYKAFGAYYRGSFADTTDRIEGLETSQTSHAARASYSSSFIEKRLLWNITYNVSRLDLRTIASGTGGEVDIPTSPVSGLSALTDTPLTSTLSQNGQLVDGNLTAGAGMDIGLPESPADSKTRNVGVEFASATGVNRLMIWVDRDLPAEVANSFSWEIYSSSDNSVWRREAVVSAAPFGPFDNRFQLDFADVSARYVKAVTRPLSVAVPDATRFPDILVTEVQAFLRRPAGESSTRQVRTNQILSTDVRMRLLDVPSLYYEGYYLYNETGPSGPTLDTLSNGLAVDHAFARVFSTNARFAREQGSQPKGYLVANVSNATFTVEPIQTFRSSLLYTGRDERRGDLSASRRGLVIQNVAQIYRGVDLLCGFGWNVTRREDGEVSHDQLLNVSLTVVPRQRVSFTFSYDGASSERSGVFTGPPEYITRRAYAAVVIDPIRTLHLAIGEEVYSLSGQRTRTTLNVNANWAPFPDGALQFTFGYNEALRALEFGTERSTVGAVRWNLSSRSYLDVTYQRIRSELVGQRAEGKIFSTALKLFF